jgi:hypothetical protein
MLENLPFVPGRRYPFTRVVIGLLTSDVGTIEVKDTTHIDRYFTSGHGGGTLTDFKGFTITGTIEMFVARSGNMPHGISSNLPERFTRPLFKIWLGGYYAEGLGAIADRDVSAAGSRFTMIKVGFESHGFWKVVPNVVELP